MKRKYMLLIVQGFTLLILTGCWSRWELNELALASAMGIDKTEQGYAVSIQVINPGEIAADVDGYDSPVTTYHADGETILEALRRITTLSPRRVYFSHLRMVIIGEELAKHGYMEAMDFLIRNNEMRMDFNVVVAKDAKAAEVLNILTSLEKIPANKMYSSLETSTKLWAATEDIHIDTLITDLVSEGKHPVLTGLRIQGDPDIGAKRANIENVEQSTFLQYSGMAVLKHDRLIGWLNEEESKGYNYTQEHVESTALNVPCSDKGGLLGLEVTHVQTNIKGRVKQGEPQIDLQIKLEASIGDIECKIDLADTQVTYDLEQKAEQLIKETIEKAIHKAQKEYKIDLFGFGDAMHRGAPDYWQEVKDDWDQKFEELVVNIDIELYIPDTGTIVDSFIKDVKG